VESGRVSAEPSRDCALCPRLAAFRAENRRALPSFHNAPVPAFAASEPARLLIVGLAPGLKGANRTGRPFTGDYAGDLLYATLLHFGFAHGNYDERADDGLRLVAARITNAVRCVPPENKPTGAEIAMCNRFLAAELDALLAAPDLRVIVALGAIAHGGVLRALGLRASRYAFGHGAEHALETKTGRTVSLIDSYHCSRYNTNTGRLTEPMFHAVFARAKTVCEQGAPSLPSRRLRR
jgi:uracil-DNA glycosylase family 4